MKRTNNSFVIFLIICFVALLGTTTMVFLEHMFGAGNVFIACVVIVAIVGGLIVPFIQLGRRKKQVI